MTLPAFEEIQQDQLALAVARVLAIANEVAIAQGTVLSKTVITITEESSPPNRLWRVHYGPRDYVHRRGGDLTIVVDESDGVVQRVIRGQ